MRIACAFHGPLVILGVCGCKPPADPNVLPVGRPIYVKDGDPPKQHPLAPSLKLLSPRPEVVRPGQEILFICELQVTPGGAVPNFLIAKIIYAPNTQGDAMSPRLLKNLSGRT